LVFEVEDILAFELVVLSVEEVELVFALEVGSEVEA
jgi:hypothetical protein